MAVEADVKTILIKLDNARDEARKDRGKLDALVVDLADVKINQAVFIERIDGFDRNQVLMTSRIDAMNGNVRTNVTDIARLQVNQVGSKELTGELKNDVKSMSIKVAGAVSLLAIIATIVINAL